MLSFSLTPTTDTNVTNRSIITHYDLALIDGTLHQVRLSTTHNAASRQITSFAERLAVTSPQDGLLVINHDLNLYATVAFYACRHYSLEALTEAHEDAQETMRVARRMGNGRITSLFVLPPDAD